MTDDAARREQVEALAWFERLIDLDPAPLEQALSELRAADAGVHARVERMIAADRVASASSAGGILGGTALQWMPQEDAAETAAAGDLVGQYRLERPLGRGGMGEVWLAHRTDGVSDAPVALKLLHAHLASSRLSRRFLREGRILGQMLHPNIARLLDAGLADGQPFLALEYVDGGRIDAWCDERQLDVPARLALFLQVCDAVTHAHAHLVVHRDLKPSNILVTSQGVVKLLDFGVAKLLDDESVPTGSPGATELTRVGDRLLTPEYAAPEQMVGAAVTTATDVYSLGVVLYLILSGRRPHSGQGRELEDEVVRMDPKPLTRALEGDAEVAARRATSLRRLGADLRGDLDTIVAKALKKSPGDRYSSVQAFADDLRRFLDHQPVLARPDSIAYRAGKYLRRHRVALAAAAAVFAALAIGLGAALWQAERARESAVRATEEALRVKKVKDFFVSIFADADPVTQKDQAAVTLKEAFEHARKRIDDDVANDPSLQADLLNAFGEIVGDQGDVAQEGAMIRRALALYEKTRRPDDPSIASALANLGFVTLQEGRPVDARPFLERAIAIYAKYPDTLGGNLANARGVMATTYFVTGDKQRALEFETLAADYYRQNPDQPGASAYLGNLGMIQLGVHRLDDARASLQLCVDFARRGQHENGIDMAHCQIGLTRVDEERGDWAHMAQSADLALVIARRHFAGDSDWIVRALERVGLARWHRDDAVGAEAALEEAEAMARHMGAWRDRAIEIERIRVPVLIDLSRGPDAVAAIDDALASAATVSDATRRDFAAMREKALAIPG